jgi:hypothetical protein
LGEIRRESWVCTTLSAQNCKMLSKASLELLNEAFGMENFIRQLFFLTNALCSIGLDTYKPLGWFS